MAELNWNLLQVPDIAQNALAAFDKGQQRKQQERSRNALAAIMGGGAASQAPGQIPYAHGGGFGGGIAQERARIDGQSPQNIPWNDLTPDDAKTAFSVMKFQQEQQSAKAKQQQDAQKQHQEQIGLIGRLLSNVRDEGSYQQALAAARQGGIDLTDVPPSYDPTWVDHTKMLVSAFEKDGGQQISGLARELQDAGYQPGTPAFQEAMGVALQGKYAPQYTDGQGNLRQGSLPRLPAPGQPAPQAPMPKIIQQRPAGMDDAELFRQAQEAVAGGANRNEVFEQLQAWGVKP